MKKIKYIGMSLGTTQMFYGLQSPVSKEILETVLEKVVLLAPVTIADVESVFTVSFIRYDAYMAFLDAFDM